MKWTSIALLFVPSLACAAVTQDGDGWTVVLPSVDTQIVYVSSSTGDDVNSGLSEELPKKTLSAAYAVLRDTMPDWVLLKRGDTWDGETFADQWEKSGRSADEPMLIGSYGSGARPLIKFEGHLFRNEKNGPDRSNVMWLDLDLWNANADPMSDDFDAAAQGYSCFRWREAGADMHIENCRIRGFGIAVEITNRDDTRSSNRWTIRRNQIYDNKGQGCLMLGQTDMVIEGNFWDKNGWQISRNHEGRFAAHQRSHGLYITDINMTNLTVKDNIITRSCSHGVHFRPGGLLEGNVLIYNPISLESGYPNPPNSMPDGVDLVMRDNLVLHGTDISDKAIRGSGISLKNIRSALVENNLVLHVRSRFTNTYGFQIRGSAQNPSRNIVIRDNIFWNWDRGGPDLKGTDQYVTIESETGNYYYDHSPIPAGNFDAETTNWVDPNRTIETYMKSLNRKPDFEGFINETRKMSKANWKDEYTAQGIQSYFRAGFTIAP